MSRNRTSTPRLIEPQDLAIYRCVNNDCLALKYLPNVRYNEEKLQERQQKYERFRGANFHLLFQPRSAINSAPVQEILDARDTENLSHPFDKAWIVKYDKDLPDLEAETLRTSLDELHRMSQHSAYLKLELTFHSRFFFNQDRSINEDRVKHLANLIKSATSGNGIQAVEIKLNSCNSFLIDKLFYATLNEGEDQAKPKYSVKSTSGLALIEMYKLPVQTSDLDTLEADPKVHALKPKEYLPFSEMEENPQRVLTEICDKNFKLKDKGTTTSLLPLIFDNYVIVNPKTQLAPHTKTRVHPFAGGEKLFFQQLYKNGELIPEDERMDWKRIGDKIIPSETHENYVRTSPDYELVKRTAESLRANLVSGNHPLQDGFEATIVSEGEFRKVICKKSDLEEGATAIEILIFDSVESHEPTHRIKLDDEILDFDPKNSPLKDLELLLQVAPSLRTAPIEGQSRGLLVSLNPLSH